MTKLTHKEIDAMEAGPEMDKLMAELVMGLDIASRPEHTWRKLDVDETDSYQSVYVCEVCNCIPGWIWKDELEKYASGECQPTIAQYSKHIAVAWPIVEKYDAYEINWTNWRRLHRCKLSKYDNPETVGIGWADTICLAICRAAYKVETNG